VHAVELGAKNVKKPRQQRQRTDDRDDGDEQAEAEAAHERQRHKEHDGEADRDRRAAEHDSAAGGRHRPRDRLVGGAAGPQLLAVTVDDE
jgi:hypothetical protein